MLQDTTMALLPDPVVAHGTTSPQIHYGHIQHQDNLIGNFGDTNTQVVMEHHPRVNSINISFKREKIHSDVICRMYGLVSSLSGSPVVMSGLAIVTGALVSMVMRHDLFLSAFRLSSPSLTNILGGMRRQE
jgi:hypothetical protein